jgi:hypothetical protein
MTATELSAERLGRVRFSIQRPPAGRGRRFHECDLDGVPAVPIGRGIDALRRVKERCRLRLALRMVASVVVVSMTPCRACASWRRTARDL